jgi:hypothetical protein
MEIFASQGAPLVSTTRVANLPLVSRTLAAVLSWVPLTLVADLPSVSTTLAVSLPPILLVKFADSVNGHWWQLATGINDIGSKFGTSVNDILHLKGSL